MADVELRNAESGLNHGTPTPSENVPPSPANPPSAVRNPPSRADRFRAYRTLWLVAVILFGLDRLTKYLITSHLPYGAYGELHGAITVIRGFFYLVHVGNPGAAWSMFTGYGAVLALLAVLTLGAIFYWRRALGLSDPILQIAFGLLCGGIVGNLADRVRYGVVIDFIDLHFGSYTYPTFNIADSGICIGVLLYLWHSLRTKDGAAPSMK